MELFFEAAFWVAAGLLASTYAAYPVATLCASVLRRRRARPAPEPRRVSVVIAARPGDPGIGARVRAALALDYPRELLEVIVASTRRSGAACAAGEIVVVLEPGVLVHADALRHVVRAFDDPGVGGVSGNRLLLRSHGEEPTLRAERLYADWEKWIGLLESSSEGIAWPDAAVWAFRREHFAGVHFTGARGDGSLELAVAANVVAAGRRVVWEPRALTWEHGGDAAQRFEERARATRDRLATLRRRPDLLNPFRHGAWSVTVFSHGPIRWLAPLFLGLALAASSALAAQHSGYRAAAVAQLGFYALAALGWLARASRIARSPLLCVPLFLCLVWIADLVALAPPGWFGARVRTPASDWTTPPTPA
ncbi:MAG: hypothetical protein ACT4PE_08180 [Candidatus Eiseniibacteriota bacterium]